MRKTFALMLTILVLLSGCSRDPHAGYVGVWHSADGTPKTFEITRDGQSYFLQDLRDYNREGRLNAPLVLSPEGGQLVVKSGFGQLALALRSDGQQLVLDKWTLSKVSAPESEKVKTAIAFDFAKRAKDRNDCQALGKLFEERENEINRTNDAPKVKLDKHKALKAEKIAKASEINDCKRQLLIY